VRLLEIYHQITLPLLPVSSLWARWTPQELAHHLGIDSGHRDKALEDLSRLLEHAYWSGDLAEEKIVPRARELARRTNASVKEEAV